MYSTETISKITKLINSKMKELFLNKLISVILYGSYARGDAENDSDIDIMVIVNMNKLDLCQYRRVVSNFANSLDLQYDVLVSIKLQDKDTFDQWQNTLPFFKNIKREGIVISA